MKLSVKKIHEWRTSYIAAFGDVQLNGLVEPEGFAGKIQALLLMAVTTGCAWQGVSLSKIDPISKDVWNFFMRRLREEQGHNNN